MMCVALSGPADVQAAQFLRRLFVPDSELSFMKREGNNSYNDHYFLPLLLLPLSSEGVILMSWTHVSNKHRYHADCLM